MLISGTDIFNDQPLLKSNRHLIYSQVDSKFQLPNWRVIADGHSFF